MLQSETLRISYIYVNLYTGLVKKVRSYVFANISANTYSRETSRLSTELAWQDGSNDMRLDFLRYLVLEKIDILGEILTLNESTITPLQVHLMLNFF